MLKEKSKADIRRITLFYFSCETLWWGVLLVFCFQVFFYKTERQKVTETFQHTLIQSEVQSAYSVLLRLESCIDEGS